MASKIPFTPKGVMFFENTIIFFFTFIYTQVALTSTYQLPLPYYKVFITNHKLPFKALSTSN